MDEFANQSQDESQDPQSSPGANHETAGGGWAGWSGVGGHGSWGGWYGAGPTPTQSQVSIPVAPAPATTLPHRKRHLGIVTGVAAAVIAAGAVGGGIGYAMGNAPSSPTTAISTRAEGSSSPAGLTGQGLNVSAIATSTDPAVVDITTTVTEDTGDNFFGGGVETGTAEGTGMILTSSGEVLTNNHVVEGATSIKVTIEGHKGSFAARVIGTDPTDDIALIQIEGVSGLLHTVTLDTTPAIVGQPVVAIGNALGLGGTPTVTSGIVSAVGRAITAGGDFTATENLSGLIQTDAPIEPGNSGGPLLNAAAKVIGMNTAAATNTNGSNSASNVGFAITAGQASRIVAEILSGKPYATIVRGETAFLGVSVLTMTSQLAAEAGLTETTGALVQEIVPGTPAANAGMAVGDDIVAVGGTPVKSSVALKSVLARYKPGEATRVTWVNQSGQHAATIDLATAPVA